MLSDRSHPRDGEVSDAGPARLLAIIGDPIAQVRAPGLMNKLFAEFEEDALMIAVRARREDFRAVTEGLTRIVNLDGLLFTIPHKFAAVEFADSISDRARRAGSINALRRSGRDEWVGDNFDGVGFVSGLLEAGHRLEGATATLVGLGGAGSAIASSLLDAGVRRLNVSDVDQSKAHAFLNRLSAAERDRVASTSSPDLANSDLAVNATPLGLRETDPLPFDPSALPMSALVAEVIMTPSETALLRSAKRIGLATHPGISMLDAQLSMYLEFFGLRSAKFA